MFKRNFNSIKYAKPLVSAAVGRNSMVATGHSLATSAGIDILRKGGNAIDAGVAAGICINIVQHDLTSFAGVAPIIIYLADNEKVVSFDGLGRWPRRASVDYFLEYKNGKFKPGIDYCIVPAAVDSWITSLQKYGTMTFETVVSYALKYARDGFPITYFNNMMIEKDFEIFKNWPTNTQIFSPDGKPLKPGELLIQKDLANTLEKMIFVEKLTKKNREGKLKAVRDFFYKGDISDKMVRFSDKMGGLFNKEDFSNFKIREEKPYKVEFQGLTIYGCGPWCQGPVFLQALSMLKNFNLYDMGHNSSEYLHTLISVLDLAFADRETYYGDPGFIDVPIEELLSDSYNEKRVEIIENSAFGKMPRPGNTRLHRGNNDTLEYFDIKNLDKNIEPESDTSYVSIIDENGNIFSATPSDASTTAPIIPGIGLTISSRGRQSRIDHNHPNKIEPLKRPRLTPSPALVLKDNKPLCAIGTPGGDVQPQAMLQVFLNMFIFHMDPQQAVESPRVASYNFPGSFYPNKYYPGTVKIETRIPKNVRQELDNRGYNVVDWGEWSWQAGGVCISFLDPTNNIFLGGADPRRSSSALGF